MSDRRIRELVRSLLLDMTPAQVLEHVAREVMGEPMDLAKMTTGKVVVMPADPERVFLASYAMDYEGDEHIGIFSMEAAGMAACERAAVERLGVEEDWRPEWRDRNGSKSSRVLDNYTFSVERFALL